MIIPEETGMVKSYLYTITLLTYNLIKREYPITNSIVAMLEHLMTIRMKYKYSEHLIELLD